MKKEYLDPWSPQAQERVNNAFLRDSLWNRDPELIKAEVDAQNAETIAKFEHEPTPAEVVAGRAGSIALADTVNLEK